MQLCTVGWYESYDSTQQPTSVSDRLLQPRVHDDDGDADSVIDKDCTGLQWSVLPRTVVSASGSLPTADSPLADRHIGSCVEPHTPCPATPLYTTQHSTIIQLSTGQQQLTAASTTPSLPASSSVPTSACSVLIQPRSFPSHLPFPRHAALGRCGAAGAAAA